MENKQLSSKKLALIILLWLLPVIGGLIYIFVECLHKGDQSKRRKNETFIAAISVFWFLWVPAIILTMNATGAITLDKLRMKEDNLKAGCELL